MRKASLARSIIVFLLALAATWSLLLIGQNIDRILPGAWTTEPGLNHQWKYQLATLTLTIVLLAVMRALKPESWRTYFRRGEMSAPTKGIRLLGIKRGESWRRIGTTFAVIVTAVTALTVWMQVIHRSELRFDASVVFWVPVLAAVNAFVEEMITRFGVIVGLDGVLKPSSLALVSGAVFGTVHYFGTPSGAPGVILAGFLGWFLARSVLETKGMAWACLIHAVQDVVIMTALLSAGRP